MKKENSKQTKNVLKEEAPDEPSEAKHAALSKG